MGLLDIFGGGSSGSQAIKHSKQNQQRIRQGMDQLNAIFHGGSYGINPLTKQSFNTGQPAYMSQGQQWKFDPTDEAFQKFYKKKKADGFSLGGSIGGGLAGQLMGGGLAGQLIGGGMVALTGGGALLGGSLGGRLLDGSLTGKLLGGRAGKLLGGSLGGQLIGGSLGGQLIGGAIQQGGKGGIKEARWKEKYGKHLSKKGELFGGYQTMPGFQQDFYDQAANAYTDYAMPQLLSQYNDARQNVDYNLSDRGLSGGSAARQQVEGLNNQAVLQRQSIANEGIARANQLQRSVEEQYAILAGQLQQSTDPAQGTANALQAASQFSVPSYSGPLGQMFGNYANQFLAGQQGGQYGRLAGTYAGTYGRPRTATDGVKPITWNA